MRLRWLGCVVMLRIARPALDGAQRLGPPRCAMAGAWRRNGRSPWQRRWRGLGAVLSLRVAQFAVRGAERLAHSK